LDQEEDLSWQGRFLQGFAKILFEN